ncbi:hypothetical protein [Streptomyces sp. NPDC048242]|uniref:hypothetical protein n=1 Tax=Streptomyces sp. NPDC048242 TaxID=3155026 RepID=UPI0033CA6C30
MTAPLPEETAPPAFRFEVGPEFHEMPLGLGDDEETHGDRLREFAHDYWGGQEDLEPLRLLTRAVQAAGAQTLVEGGAVYQAIGVFPIGGSADGTEPPERISRATLTVSVRELENPDPHLTAAGISEVLAQDDGESEVQLITLPAGPGIVRVAGSRSVWELPDEEELEQFHVRIEVWLPFPSEDRLLLLCLSTADVRDLFHYQAVLADIADTVAFGETVGAGDAEPADHSAPLSPFTAY